MQKGSRQRLGEAKRRTENRNEKKKKSLTAADESREQTRVRTGTTGRHFSADAFSSLKHKSSTERKL